MTNCAQSPGNGVFKLMRFFLHEDGVRSQWRHYAEAPLPGWTDCTDMTDLEFEALVKQRQKQ